MFSLFTNTHSNSTKILLQKDFSGQKKFVSTSFEKVPKLLQTVWKSLLRTFAAAAAASASACFRLRSSSLKKYKLLIQFQK